MMRDKKHAKSSWISKNQRESVKKPWGHEKSWSGFNGIHGKTLFIRKGCRTSLKYHKQKSEVLYIRTGKVKFTFGDELSLEDPVGHPFKIQVESEGTTLMVQSGCPYRLEAIVDSEIIEIGNNRSDRPVRIEDDHGRCNEKQ